MNGKERGVHKPVRLQDIDDGDRGDGVSVCISYPPPHCQHAALQIPENFLSRHLWRNQGRSCSCTRRLSPHSPLIGGLSTATCPARRAGRCLSLTITHAPVHPRRCSGGCLPASNLLVEFSGIWRRPYRDRAREKSVTGISTGTAAVPAAMCAGRPSGSGTSHAHDDVPQGLRRSQWATGVRSGQFTDPAYRERERPARLVRSLAGSADGVHDGWSTDPRRCYRSRRAARAPSGRYRHGGARSV